MARRPGEFRNLVQKFFPGVLLPKADKIDPLQRLQHRGRNGVLDLYGDDEGVAPLPVRGPLLSAPFTADIRFGDNSDQPFRLVDGFLHVGEEVPGPEIPSLEYDTISSELQPPRRPRRPRLVAAGIADEEIERLIDHAQGNLTPPLG